MAALDRLLAQLQELQPASKSLQILDLEIDNDSVLVVPLDERPRSETQPESASTKWFYDKCDAIAASQANDLDGNQLATLILSTLRDSTFDEETLQTVLCDMIGFDNIEFVADILMSRNELLAAPKISAGLSEAETLEWKKDNRAKTALRAANLEMSAHVDPRYPHVYRKQGVETASVALAVKRVLPEGTTRESLPSYEHVVIPAQRNNTEFHPKRLIGIKDLDELCRVTFSKYEHLNKVQSLVFPICYESTENMLICAPTGAGKTDVALLSILSAIKSARDTEESYKIVYVAPLKALAAEITEKLGSRLAWLGVKVRELTGDMQLTRAEIAATHVIVTTPEKWDVVTRKPNDDSGLAKQLRLLIVDEVHLLHEDRGAVIESIVARTRRQVEAQQRVIRIVGLSATLPNFVDVAEFLGVNPQRGLFFFDGSFRPVPLEQQFYGVRAANNPMALSKALDRTAFDECVKQLRRGHSVMIFVHSRKDTSKTARTFMQMAQQDGVSDLFIGENADQFKREMQQFNHRNMQELFQSGFATHHAGMSRAERNLSEKMFGLGGVRVLCCTATLAWGVNLPAAVVIIKGTQVYDAQRGGYVDLGISDVIQIFGRAGRPQFEQSGTGVLCTSVDRLDHYLDAITNQYPIESRFAKRVAENMNAEVSLGTVSNVAEAVQWLGYTYMYVRMRKAPQVYGLLPRDLSDDPALIIQRRKQVIEAARLLRDTQMLVFEESDPTESFIAKDIGRIASEFYLLRTSVEQFNELMSARSTEQQLLRVLSIGADFEGLKTRQEEQTDLDNLVQSVPFNDLDAASSAGKTSALLQGYISRVPVSEPSLASDMAYVAQNSARILRAFFLLCISRRWADAAGRALTLNKALSQRQWPDEGHALLQLGTDVPAPVARRLNSSNIVMEDLKAYSSKELGDLVHNHGWGARLLGMVLRFPLPAVYLAQARPLTASVVQIDLEVALLQPFKWDHKIHTNALHYWVFVHEDSPEALLLHVDKVVFTPHNQIESQKFEFAIPVLGNPNQLIIRIESDNFISSETVATLNLSNVKLPEASPAIRTNLLRLRPLPLAALQHKSLEKYYRSRFQHFNPMQTMVFHSLFYSQTPVLLGSPTGSGKTIACEMAVWAALRDRPDAKVIYIAPMKALVKERVSDWSQGICRVPFLPGNRRAHLIELTGDTVPKGSDIHRANIIVTTPEKYDGISRFSDWATQKVSLVIMDEVHLLASDRGAILEMIVSRLNLFGKEVRLLGMSTAVANAVDLASWLGVKSNAGLFNFPSSVRPVPLEMYIDGFPEVQGGFCPLMKSMNKPTYMAIKRHAPNKPALVFVASRRQTRLTAMDLINLCGSGDEENPRRWLHMSEEELELTLTSVKDETLRLTLQFGVAIHHAGLEYSDRQISHELFAAGKVQVLVATSTLAWGVNLPAYLVVVKGTQFFDAKINRYKDMDLTDVLQMMGRAGRPAFDSSGVAVVYTKQSTKQFYKYFLNLGFPVESSLHKPHVLENHLGAEISAKRISSKQQAVDFLQATFLFRRVHANPSYYGIGSASSDEDSEAADGSAAPVEQESSVDAEQTVNKWLFERIETCITELEHSQCLTASSTAARLHGTPYLSIASFYYIHHLTMRMFLSRLPAVESPKGVLQCLALASEYDELAIRHNEDVLNTELSKSVAYPGEDLGLRMVDPHVKAYMLVQARMRRLEMPIEDYIQDTITVLDQAVRILQAFIDTAAQVGLFSVARAGIHVLRSMKQGVDGGQGMLHILPGVKPSANGHASKIGTLKDVTPDSANTLHVPRKAQASFVRVVKSLPKVLVDKSNKMATFNPSNESVWCPMFHKPQRESWFLIRREGERVISLERVQRAKTVRIDSGTLTIMNDTLDIDYELDA